MPEISLPANEVFPILQKNILVDGFHIVIDLERSHGSVMVDALTGEEYLDCYTYFATLPIGHNHPKMRDEGFRSSLMAAALSNPANSDVYSREFAAFVKIFREIGEEYPEVEKDVAHREARLYRFDRRRYQQLVKRGFSFEI